MILKRLPSCFVVYPKFAYCKMRMQASETIWGLRNDLNELKSTVMTEFLTRFSKLPELFFL